MRLRIYGAVIAGALAACGGEAATKDGTGDGFPGSGGTTGVAGQSGANAGAGVAGAAGVPGDAGGAGAVGGGPGDAGGAGANGLAGGPQVEPTLFVQRPGRPRLLVLDGVDLRWVLAPTEGNLDGPIESLDVGGGEVRTSVPAEAASASYSSLPSETFIYTAGRFGVGGLRRIPKAGGALETVLEDPEPSFDLAVLGDTAFRIRGGEHAETWLERIDLTTKAKTRVSVSSELDAYIGDFVTDGAALFYTMQAFGSESGLYRAPLDGGTQVLLAPGGDDVIALANDEIIRIRRGFQTGEGSFVVDAVPKAGGASRPLFASDLGGLGQPTLLGAYLYFIGLGTIGEPHKLLRAPLAGGQPSVVVEALCLPDTLTPSVVASATTLYVACTTEGVIRAITPPE